MGLTYATIELINTIDLAFDLALVQRSPSSHQAVRSLEVSALVDSGASMLSIPQSVCDRLGLAITGEGDVELADGSVVQFDIVGPVEVRYQNRRTIVEALVIPNETEVLLGTIPMEGMDVLIDPTQHRLIVNPKSPHKARLFLK